eukprot:1718327-Pyramimonas_sp.AAC.1
MCIRDRSRGAPLSELDRDIDSEIDVVSRVSRGVPLGEIGREIDSEIDTEIERCPAVSRGVPWWPAVPVGVPLSEIDSETDIEIDKCPAVSRGVPLSEIVSEID